MNLHLSTYQVPASTCGAARTTWVWLTGALVVLGLYLGSFTVQAGEVAIVARFGDPRRQVDEPGLHFKWPAPVDTVFRVDMRTHVLDPVIEEFLTNDQKSVKVDAFVAWRVADPQQFLKSLRSRTGAEEKIGQVLQSSLNGILRSGDFSDLVNLDPEGGRDLAQVRADVTEAVRERCRAGGYGVEIEMAGIERINFPQDNRDDVEKAMRSSRQLESRSILAGSREDAATIESKAQTDADKIVTTARAAALASKGKAEATALKEKNASWALNPELFDLVNRLDVAQQAMGNANLIIGYDHPLMRVFDGPTGQDSIGESAPVKK